MRNKPACEDNIFFFLVTVFIQSSRDITPL